MPAESEPARKQGSRRHCLVLQGFGRRIDPYSGRSLDLDSSYRMIREAVDGFGLDTVRFDFVQPPTYSDGRRLREIYQAPLVIADLSASVDAVLLELGLRFALCPRRTLVVAEEQSLSLIHI